jgi:hypothetical protein
MLFSYTRHLMLAALNQIDSLWEGIEEGGVYHESVCH